MLLLDSYLTCQKEISELFKIKKAAQISEALLLILKELNISYEIDSAGEFFELINSEKYFEEYNISYLNSRARSLKLYILFETTEFTTTTLDSCLEDHSQSCVFLADYQLEARGQYARVWRSAYRQQIQTTIGPFAIKLGDSPQMLMIKIAYHCLEILMNKYPYLNLKYKWPNDIYLNDCKVAGFLLTTKGSKYFISIGLNLTYEDLKNGVGSICSTAQENLREDLLIDYLVSYFSEISIEKMLTVLNQNSFFDDGEIISYDDYLEKTLCYYRGIDQEFGCCLQFDLSDQSVSKIYTGSLNKVKKNIN